jgi:regulator of protease activity HflC (stomatin/prohibitin superfamily)
MRRDVDIGDSQLLTLPRFQLAARSERLLKRILVVCLFLFAVLVTIIGSPLLLGLRPVLVVQLAELLVLCASVHSVWWITRWRIRALKAASQNLSGESANAETVLQAPEVFEPNSLHKPIVSPSRFTQFCHSLNQYGFRLLAFIQARANVLNSLITVALAGLVLWLVSHYWNSPLTSLQTLAIGQVPARFIVVICLFIAAFAALVLERYFTRLIPDQPSLKSASALPEAVHITHQLRVYIALSLLSCGLLLLGNETRQWPIIALTWLGILPAAIAVEFLLRAVLLVFSPPHKHEPELLAKSLLTELLAEELWRWPPKPFSHLQDELKNRFGIDLRQSWAFAYIRRSLIPILGVLLGIAWLYSGLVEIPMAERGIYERFGAPVAVWQPGIHAGLPWPMGRVQRMENGVVHELSATLNEQPKESGAKTTDIKNDLENALPSAEDAPPASANRLWDASHLAEKSQIIASEVSTSDGNRQSFHIVNMDVRFMYRIGLSDSAALDARYTSADAPALIRSTANRILVRYFAARTLEGVLGEARTQMAKEIGTQLQADLDSLNSGVEIMSTVLEAIHPPAAAANAYHAVQAAQIKAQAIISRERGNAAQQVNLAQVRALIARNEASATARQTIATAEVANRRFLAERDAYQQGGKAFLMEQYFAQLTQGLKNAQLLLVDHRLPNTDATIDLRNFAGGDKKTASSPALAPTVDYQESP